MHSMTPSITDLIARAEANRREGRVAAAEDALRQAVALAPDDVAARIALGDVCQQLGNLTDAVVQYRRALDLKPNQPRLCNALGILHVHLGRLSDAEKDFRRAIALKSDYAKAMQNLANVLTEQNRHADAVAAYQSAETAGYCEASLYDGWAGAVAALGDVRSAETMLQSALRNWPENPGLLKRLGIVLSQQLCWDGAAACLRQSVQKFPADPEARRQYGQVLVRLGRLDQAETQLRECLRGRPADTGAGNDLAVALLQQGKLDQARVAFDRVLALQPDNAAAHSLRLYLLNYDHQVPPAELLQEHRNWANRFAHSSPATPASFLNDRVPDRRLRIGYASPDFRRHPVGRFLEPILNAHDPHQVEVVCYDEAVRMPDDVTARLRSKADWRITRGMSNAHYAEQVRADRIDILVDLAGHTADNRLGAFSRRLAPIQVTYLGYPNTTGVPALDYLLTDAVTDPPDQPTFFTEEAFRLPGGFCCFAPRTDAPAASLLPARRNGFVTFGAPHTLGKLNAAVLDMWAELIKAVPNAHLLIARSTLTGGTLDYFKQQFNRRGIGDDRLELQLLTSGEGEYLGLYTDVDITLDSFPWTGHTTACESLWMGVPVITLRGASHRGRMVASVLTHAGLPEWIAETPEEYVALAARWAANLDELATVRAGLRERLRRSQLCDAVGFTWQLESAYREMWRHFCIPSHHKIVASLPVEDRKAEPPSRGTQREMVTTVAGAITQASQFAKAGRFAPAEQICLQVLKVAPKQADAWLVLGDACKGQGKSAEAMAAYQHALQLQPGLAEAHCGLGILFASQRDFAAAESHFRRAVEVRPGHAKSFHNLGNVLSELNKLPEAVAAYREAERLGFRDPSLLASLGMALLRQRQFAAAEAVYRQALGIRAGDAATHRHLGLCLAELNKPAEAISAFKRAQELGLKDAALYDNLSQAYTRIGLYHEAVGPATEAARLKGDNPDVLKRLGFVLNKVAKFEASVDAYQRALQLRPEDAEAYWRLGMVHTRQGFLDRAIACNREAVRLQPKVPAYLSGLASAYVQNGDIDPALDTIRAAIQLNPDYPEAHSSLLFMLCYDPNADPDEVFEEHKRWATRFASSPAKPPIHANSPAPDRKLRVGYVSPDLRNHPVGFFVEPVIQSHDADQFELVCYDECVWPPDQLAARLQKKVKSWRVSRGMSDDELAAQIRADRIDILVDLAGHTASNRLRLFAQKPAPVQLTWLGYPHTSGLTTMDFVLTDAVADPPHEPWYFTEQPYRLPCGFCCYVPRPGMPDVAPLPAAANGRLTFGSLHNQAKLNPRVLDLWAEVLKAAPSSRLTFVRHTLTEEARQALRTALAARGIAPERLDFRQPPAGSAAYVQSYAEIDIQLDPFPWTGHTTACESLWMGVPSLTLRGRTHAGRMVASVMIHAGLQDWVADTSEQYVALAARWATRIPELAKLRGEMRQMLGHSSLGDVPGFTRNLEIAYRTMWRRWCVQTLEPSAK
jgi:predicted O-linked N-acetylglucosamine transferase (SPINDLY family)